MGRDDLFSYLSAFVTIVLAVALSDLIQSTHALLRARKRVQWNALPLLFAIFVTLGVVSEFFSLWGMLDVTRISFFRLLWLLTIPTIWALLAYSTLPDEVPEQGMDLGEFYFTERRLWVVLVLLGILLDNIRVAAAMPHDPGWLPRFLAWLAPIDAVTFGGLAAMWFARSRWLQLVGVCALLAGLGYGIFRWTISAVPGA